MEPKVFVVVREVAVLTFALGVRSVLDWLLIGWLLYQFSSEGLDVLLGESVPGEVQLLRRRNGDVGEACFGLA